jgi:spore coat protein U domain-containing protein, fimbrial subunit CupE1/2/3/6
MMRNLCMVIIVSSVLCIPSLAHAAGCNITLSGGFVFGNYDPYNGSPTNSTATNLISVSCNGNGTATVDLNTGSSGTYFPRSMISGTDTLTYNLYTTASLTSVWGDGTGGTVDQSFAYHGSTSASYSVYGQIPAQQNVNTGSYTDTITITVTF